MSLWRLHCWGGWGNLGCRIPQVVAEYDGKIARYEDGTSELSANIPPAPNVTGAWVWTGGKTLALIQANAAYCVDVAECLDTFDPKDGATVKASTGTADLDALRAYLSGLGVVTKTLDDNLGTSAEGKTADSLRLQCVTWCRALKLTTTPIEAGAGEAAKLVEAPVTVKTVRARRSKKA